jgi:hypothetical protein
MFSVKEIGIVKELVHNAYIAGELHDYDSYNNIVDTLIDMRDDAAYTEECQRENELEALEASATYNCLGLPQWCGKCHVCKAYGVKEGPGTE